MLPAPFKKQPRLPKLFLSTPQQNFHCSLNSIVFLLSCPLLPCFVSTMLPAPWLFSPIFSPILLAPENPMWELTIQLVQLLMDVLYYVLPPPHIYISLQNQMRNQGKKKYYRGCPSPCIKHGKSGISLAQIRMSLSVSVRSKKIAHIVDKKNSKPYLCPTPQYLQTIHNSVH